MNYLAHFLFSSPVGENRGFGYFTCITEAASSEEAMEKFEEQIYEISENSDLFDEVAAIYLEDIIEFSTLPNTAVLTRFEIFAGERPTSANITMPDQEGTEKISFYRPVEADELNEDSMVPFIEFE